MKELKIVNGDVKGYRIFKDTKEHTSIVCAYRDNYPNCSPDCAACSLKIENKNSSKQFKSVTCFRGNFHIGNILNPDK